MKIKPADYAHLETTIRTFEAAHRTECTAHKAAHTPTRYAWDVVHAAGLTPYVCDVLYKYLNDDHIKTALLQIVKRSLAIEYKSADVEQSVIFVGDVVRLKAGGRVTVVDLKQGSIWGVSLEGGE